MRILFGVCGEIRSGKETFFKLLTDIVHPLPVTKISTSDFLKEKVVEKGELPTRSNLQQMAVDLVTEYGPGFISQTLKQRIEDIPEGFVIFDSVRWESDFEMVKSFPHGYIVYITADPEIRYKRVLQAHGKVGESSTTYEQFLKESQAKTEVLIGELGAKADFRIDNNTTLADLKQKITKIITELGNLTQPNS